MRLPTFPLLLLALSLTLISCQNPPELKLAFDYQLIDSLQAQYIQPILNNLVPTINLTNGTTLKEGPLTIIASNITIPSFSLDWNNTHILTANSNYQPSIQIRNLSAVVQLDLDIKIPLIPYKGSNEQLIIDGMDLDIALGFDTLPDETTYAYFDSVSVSIGSVSQNLNPKFQQFLVDFIEKFGSLFGLNLSTIVSNLVQNTIIGYNQTIINMTTAGFNKTVLDFLQVQVSLADLPVVFDVSHDAWQMISLNLEIVNLNTSETAPVASVDELPNYIPNNGLVELFISEDMIAQLLWAAFQSGKINLFLNNETMPASFPVQLTTTDLVILFPGINTEFGEGNGVYFNVQKGGDYPIVFVRDGRLVLELALLLDIYVDNDAEEYPVATLAECTACSHALSLNISAFVALDVYSIDSATIGATVMDIILSEVDLLSGNLSINRLQSTLNGLLVPLLGQINLQLKSGFKVPGIGLLGIDGISLSVGTNYLLAGILFDL